MQADREDTIRKRAYILWQQDGCPEGKDFDYWLRAETEMATERYAGVTDDGKFVRHPADPEKSIHRRDRS